jgi:thiol-disulfide isomerase/thioredoxin
MDIPLKMHYINIMHYIFPRPLFVTAFFIFLLILPRTLEGQEKPIPDTVKRAFSQARIPLLRKQVPIEDFSLPLLRGGTQTLSGLKGKVVFLNFWATWCPPCQEEMPSMERLYKRLGTAGLELLAVDIQENREDVGAFITDSSLSFPVALDESGRVSGIYGIRNIPTTFIIDRNGMIIATVVGSRNWDSPAVITAVETLLNDGQ